MDPRKLLGRSFEDVISETYIRWYTASAPAVPVEETSSTAPPKKKRKTAKKPNAVNPYDPINATYASTDNGAGPSAPSLINRNGRASPILSAAVPRWAKCC